MILVQVSVDKIHGGDRAGICVTQFDPKLLERGLVRPTNNILTLFQFSFLGLHTWKCSQHLGSSCLNGKDSIFQGRGLQKKKVKSLTQNCPQVKSKAKFHISLGHETVLAKLTLLHGGVSSSSAKDTFDFSPEYHYQVILKKEQQMILINISNAGACGGWRGGS